MTASAWPALADPTLVADPYPYYARMHAEEPLRWDPTALGVGWWAVAGHAEVTTLVRDPRLSADRTIAWRMFLPQDDAGRRTGDLIAGGLALKDPPDHTRLRGLLTKVFTPRAVERLRGHVERIVDELLAPTAGGGDVEIISTLAKPLPVRVISELLGVPEADTPLLAPWIDDYARFFGAIKGMKRAVAAAQQLEAYFEALFDERKARPRDDLLSELIAVEDADARLSRAEVIQTVVFLYLAGHHTTTNLIGNGLFALLRAPAQLEALRREPERIGNAVEEVLRYDAPVQFIARVAREDLTIGEHAVRAGQLVALFLAAANRDPLVFEQPDALDVQRSNAARHVAFAAGPHYCIGAPLARLEGVVAFTALLRRFAEIELAAPPQWIPNLALRGLEGLVLHTRSV